VIVALCILWSALGILAWWLVIRDHERLDGSDILVCVTSLFLGPLLFFLILELIMDPIKNPFKRRKK
jgi:hypothetical protein